jgi:hypothetical protein
MQGARIVERVRVLGRPATRDGAVTGVQTDHGDIEARSSSTAPASGPRPSARWPASTVPLHSAEHFYVVTEQIDGVDRMTCRSCATPTATPTSRRRSGAWSSAASNRWPSPGCARPDPLPVRVPAARRGLGPLRDPHESALHRLPVLATPGSASSTTGPRASRPDNQFILGEAPEVRGSSSAPGSTRWASRRREVPARRWPSGSSRASRRPTWRASTSGGSRRSTATTSGCATGSARSSGCTTPCRGRTGSSRPARPFRRSPVHHLVEGAGAVFGSRWGGSVPTSSLPPGVAEPSARLLLGPALWQSWCRRRAARHPRGGRALRPDLVRQAARDRAGTPRRRSNGSAPQRRGGTGRRTVYTGVLNARGTYEADVTVTRLAR